MVSGVDTVTVTHSASVTGEVPAVAVPSTVMIPVTIAIRVTVPTTFVAAAYIPGCDRVFAFDPIG